MPEKTIDHFYSDTYHGLFSLFGDYDRKLVSMLKSLMGFEPGRILDMACGVGLSTLALRTNFPDAGIIGVDIDSGMIDFAKKTIALSEIEFQCSDITEALTRLPDHSIDMVFVKSAYHYFDKQVTISHLKPVLSENGVIAIAERTSRSAKSYPLPDIVSGYWADIFSQPRPSHRLDAADTFDMALSVSCYGEYVTLPAEIYLDAVRKNQLVGLWLLKPDVIDKWINDRIAEEHDSYRVFEEFWLYLYKNKTE